jgi:hypothetical protein
MAYKIKHSEDANVLTLYSKGRADSPTQKKWATS